MENFEHGTTITHSSIQSEKINGAYNSSIIIEHLDLQNFKLKPCGINTNHNHKNCP